MLALFGIPVLADGVFYFYGMIMTMKTTKKGTGKSALETTTIPLTDRKSVV